MFLCWNCFLGHADFYDQRCFSSLIVPSYNLCPSSVLSLCLFLQQLAMDLVHKSKAYIRGCGQKLTIVRAGLGASATVGGIGGGAQE